VVSRYLACSSGGPEKLRRVAAQSEPVGHEISDGTRKRGVGPRFFQVLRRVGSVELKIPSPNNPSTATHKETEPQEILVRSPSLTLPTLHNEAPAGSAEAAISPENPATAHRVSDAQETSSHLVRFTFGIAQAPAPPVGSVEVKALPVPTATQKLLDGHETPVSP
jgi:hypothetical protein